MKIYLIDTSYLLELYQVPDFSTSANKDGVRAKMNEVQGAMLVVTVPCLIEFANHLADCKIRVSAKNIGDLFLAELKDCLEGKGPWKIYPAVDSISHFVDSFRDFIHNSLNQGIGLCDTFTILEANRLKIEYGSLGYTVHILTLDNALKAREPDAEPNAYMGGPIWAD